MRRRGATAQNISHRARVGVRAPRPTCLPRALGRAHIAGTPQGSGSPDQGPRQRSRRAEGRAGGSPLPDIHSAGLTAPAIFSALWPCFGPTFENWAPLDPGGGHRDALATGLNSEDGSSGRHAPLTRWTAFPSTVEEPIEASTLQVDGQALRGRQAGHTHKQGQRTRFPVA